MTPEEKYELFERKINRDLTVQEEDRFAQILEDNQKFAKEFKAYTEWTSYLEFNLSLGKEQSELGQNLKQGDTSFFEEKTTQKGGEVIQIPSWVYANVETAFNTKNYDRAEADLLELLKKDPNNSKYLFYYGITLLELDKYEETTEIFTALKEGNSGYRYRAIWFEALNQLKQKNNKQCVTLLKKLPSEAEDYLEARKLLKRL